MSIIPVLFQQLIIMAIFMAVGYFLYKKKFVSIQGCKDMGNLLIYIILPATIINAYNVERTSEMTSALLTSTIASLSALLIAMLISTLLFRKNKIEHFGVSFANVGFMGIPIVSAVMGSEAVFYISSFVALLNVFQWTYGVIIMTGKHDALKPKSLIKNPVIIATAIGLLVFFLQIKLPVVITSTVSSLASMTAPIAMIILGVYLAQVDFKSVFTGKILYLSSLARLLLIPAITAVLLLIVPFSHDIKLAVMIAACAPIGSNVAVFAQIHNQDYTLAVREVCLSTLLSIATMPLVIAAFLLFL